MSGITEPALDGAMERPRASQCTNATNGLYTSRADGGGQCRSDRDCIDQNLPNMPFRYIWSRLAPFGEGRVARAAFRWRWLVAIGALALGGLQLVPVPSQPLGQPLQSNDIPAEEPIPPIPTPPAIDPRKIKLGARLFDNVRLSFDNSRSCSSCHDLDTNGASKNK